jgi:photoactive yellow protein
MAGSEHTDEGLCKQIDTMTPQELDGLPQGTIQLDPFGKILQYNLSEERRANLKREDVVGRNFFREVAPCTDVKEFHGRFIRGVRKKSLHEIFRYHFPFPKNPTDVSIILHYSARTNTVWVIVTTLPTMTGVLGTRVKSSSS